MKRLSGLLAGLVALAFAGAAPAALVQITVDTSLPPDKIFTIEWHGSGAGFYDSDYPRTGDWKTFPDADDDWTFVDLNLDADRATGWAGISPGDEGALEAQFLDRMLERLELPTASDIYFEKIEGAGNTFTTDREYFWIKTGQWIAYFRNATPGTAITVNVDGDYSHYGVAGVPIPAAFVLFGSGLVGLGWLARRQRARKDSVGEALTA